MQVIIPVHVLPYIPLASGGWRLLTNYSLGTEAVCIGVSLKAAIGHL